jgi:y4mF family transcriptional regulator
MAIIRTPQDVGELIRTARKRSGLTQQQFADLCGVGRRFLSECESGKSRLELGKVMQVLNGAGIDVEATLR